MTADVVKKVHAWLFRGIIGDHSYPPALECARQTGVADIHLDVLLAGNTLSAGGDWQWDWSQAISVFDELVEVVRNEQDIYVQMVVYMDVFASKPVTPNLSQLLAQVSATPPNFYILRRDRWSVSDEELHRYPLGNTVFNRGREGKLLCYEVSRPAQSIDDPDEFYGMIVAYWFPEVA